jgi:hypothetical protein
MNKCMVYLKAQKWGRIGEVIESPSHRGDFVRSYRDDL